MSFCQIQVNLLPFAVASAGDTFKRKTGKISQGLLNIYDVADDILIVGYDDDDKDHVRTQRQMVQIYC